METLHNRIDLVKIPYTERGSRLLLFRQEHQLFIRLAERWARWEKEVGHYRQRPPLITDFTLLADDGTPVIDFEMDSYPYRVQINTAVGVFDWTFIDPETLMVQLPMGGFGISFNVFAQHGEADHRGGVFKGKRNVAYTTNARILQNSVERIDDEHFHIRMMLQADPGDALLLNITPRLAYNRSVPDPNKAIAKSRAVWQAWFDAAPPVLDIYRRQYDFAWWIMRSGLVNTRFYFTREALVPSKIHYVGVWHWDQVFHALAYRHVDINLAEDQLRIVLDHQREDGMLPDAIHDEGLITHLEAPVNADVTKPPIITWAVLKMYESSQHRDFLGEIYEPLARWNRWWMTSNRNGNGLCQYQHPFTSGLDDSPLWDAGMPVVAPDLNTYLVLQNQNLAQIARILKEDHDAAQYEQAGTDLLANMLTYMWDEKAGVFWALHDEKPVKTLTPFNLLPLLVGRLPYKVAKLIVAKLTDPTMFWTPHPLPTVSPGDPAFDPMQMWRGPVWINVNYFFVEALKRIGQHALAGELRRKTLELMMMHDNIYEYYHPFTGDHPPKAAPMFGWSAALFIELALDETRSRQQEGELGSF